MAIQLNERDHLIFRLLAEHNVLLEKHIAWFVTSEDKPVLIRDRLRKLFYLDYLKCQRYDDKLSWWTTPTKPLIYMLTPLARAMSGSKNIDNDELSNDQQEKCLEIANIRMIFLIAQTQGLLQNICWTTCLPNGQNAQLFDALISCSNRSIGYKLGVLSHPEANQKLISLVEQELISKNITNVLIVSRDHAHQVSLQNLLVSSKIDMNKIVFATHHDLYKSEMDDVKWFNSTGQYIDFLGQQNSIVAPVTQSQIFTDLHAS